MDSTKKPESRSLSDRAAFLILANIVKFSIGVFMPMLLVRMLSQTDYGTYQQMMLVSTSVVSLLVLGLPTSVFYFYKHVSPVQIPALVMQTTWMLVIMGFLGGLGIWFGAHWISSSLNNPQMGPYLALLGISVGLTIASEQSMSFLIAQDRYGLAVYFEVAEAAIRVLILLAPLALGYGFPGLVMGLVVYSAVRFFGRNGFQLIKSKLDFSGWTKHTFVMNQLYYSFPIAIMPLTSMIGTTFNRGTVSAVFTPADYAIFAVGTVMPPLSTVFQVAVSNVLRAELPALVRDGNLTEIARIIREAVRKLSIILLPSFVFLFVHAYDFITALFTEEYARAVPVFRILVLELPLDMLVLSAIPQAFGKTKLNMYINFVTVIVLVGGSWILVKTVGFLGAAIAITICQYTTSGLFMIAVLKLTKSSLPTILPLKHIGIVMLASIMGALASHSMPALTSVPIANLIISGIVFSVVFLVLAPFVGIFTAQDRDLIRRWVYRVLPVARMR